MVRPFNHACYYCVLVMAGVADRIQVGDEIVNTVLLEANPDGERFIQRRRTKNLPSLRNTVDPRVFDSKVVPSFMQRFGERVSNKEEENESVPQHCWRGEGGVGGRFL